MKDLKPLMVEEKLRINAKKTISKHITATILKTKQTNKKPQ